MTEFRIVVADPSAPARAGSAAAVRADGRTVSAEAAAGGEELVRALGEAAGICLVDAALPGGVDAALAEIAARSPGSRTVVLAAEPDAEELLAVVKRGAVGYVDKAVDPERLPAIVRSVAAGETAIPRGLAARLLDEVRAHDTEPIVLADGRAIALSPRERAVADALRSGAPTKDIAAALSISQVTVRRHVSAVVRKLGATDRASAASLLGTVRSRFP